MTYRNRAGLLGLTLIALTPAIAQTVVTVPAGTPIQIRTVTPIDSSQAVPGQKYMASVADPVVVGNTMVIPRGSDATVQLMKTGSGNYVLRLATVTVKGRPYEVSSSTAALAASSKTGKTAKRGVLGGGIGAAIGGIAGGGKGAAIGAATGGGLGAATGALSGTKVQVAPETLLTFELQTPLEVQSAG
jgi:hypothetical protein